METDTLILTVLTASLLVAAIHAHRLGNERRDVGLMGACGGLLGLGAAASAFW